MNCRMPCFLTWSAYFLVSSHDSGDPSLSSPMSVDATDVQSCICTEFTQLHCQIHSNWVQKYPNGARVLVLPGRTRAQSVFTSRGRQVPSIRFSKNSAFVQKKFTPKSEDSNSTKFSVSPLGKQFTPFVKILRGTER